MGMLLEISGVSALALLVGMPLLTLVHELGHGLVAAVAVGGRVTIVQGPAPARLRVRVWRLDLRLRGPVAPHRVMVGWAFWGPHSDPRRHALANAAGPLTSALSAAACGAGAYLTGGLGQLLLLLLGLAATLQTLSTSVPCRYGRWFGSYAGEASDGLRIARALRGRRGPAATA
ncbi:MAG TPA: hypothetical protein VFL60_01390 [Gaiellaceae bacterium]|nr:hypothetical protein [Gaiellaceae bacterium]